MPRFGQTGITVVRPGGVVTSLPGWPYRDYYRYEDFTFGAVPIGSANRHGGDLNWWQSGPGGVQGAPAGAGTVGHPGIRRLVTGAASGQQCELQATAAAQTMAADAFFDSIWLSFSSVVDGNTELRYGLGNDAGLNPPTRGIYLEKLFADVNFFLVTREGGAQTRVDTGIPAGTSAEWVIARFARLSATELGWAVIRGAGSPVLPALTPITTNLPAGANEMRPVMRISNNAAAVKSWDVDFVDLAVFNGAGR